ncbi:MAG: D-alanyl-D-alanine carboxypeptidase family protein [Solirubrobacteraceae bacterium]
MLRGLSSLLPAGLVTVAVAGCAIGGPGAAIGGDGDDPEVTTTAHAGQAVNGPVPDPPLAEPMRLWTGDRSLVLPVGETFEELPRAGILVDLDTGEVLWRHASRRTLPIASITKVMTSLIVDAHTEPDELVRISRAAAHQPGSAVGVLPAGRKLRVDTLQYGLMLASGNDAARALAEHVGGGSMAPFVRRMNDQADALGLRCTQFANPSGFEETKYQRQARNRSCAEDLAVLARVALDRPRIAKVAGTYRVVRRIPDKQKRVELYNHNPLLREGYRGAIGLKTGFTNAAGRCIVAVAERDGRRLAVVLLHSPDPGKQATSLLNRGFRLAGPG